MRLILNQLGKDTRRLAGAIVLWFLFLVSISLPYFDLLSFAALDDFT